MILSLPLEKIRKLLLLCRQILSGTKVTLRILAQLLGLLESYRPAVWLSSPTLSSFTSSLNPKSQEHNYETEVNFWVKPIEELNWWVRNIVKVNGSPKITPKPDLTIFTDASKKGWGAVCNNLQTNGRWSAAEKLLHINVLELKGAFLAIQSLLKNQHHKTVSLNMDNSTAVAYVNHKGGTHSSELVDLTLQLWDWCIQNDLYIIAHRVPGKLNTLADQESREFRDETDWMIDPKIIRPFLTNCVTDLFATRLTRQLTTCISWRPDPHALHSDAFSLNWKNLAGYAFPPFNLIPLVLNKVVSDKEEIILVAPIWQAQRWWSLLLSLLVQQPVLLPNKEHLLINPVDPHLVHPMHPRLHLGVFHISSNVTRQKAFLHKLPVYSSQPLVAPHAKHMNQAGGAGAAGVLQGKLILFQHL